MKHWFVLLLLGTVALEAAYSEASAQSEPKDNKVIKRRVTEEREKNDIERWKRKYWELSPEERAEIYKSYPYGREREGDPDKDQAEDDNPILGPRGKGYRYINPDAKPKENGAEQDPDYYVPNAPPGSRVPPAGGLPPYYIGPDPPRGKSSPAPQKPLGPSSFRVPSSPPGKAMYVSRPINVTAPSVPFPKGAANPFGNAALKPGPSGGSGQPAFVPRVTFDDSASKRPAPKGVSMRVGIDRGTVQRLQAPPSLIAAIRADN